MFAVRRIVLALILVLGTLLSLSAAPASAASSNMNTPFAKQAKAAGYPLAFIQAIQAQHREQEIPVSFTGNNSSLVMPIVGMHAQILRASVTYCPCINGTYVTRGCGIANYDFKAKNIAHKVTWRFTMRLEYCWKSTLQYPVKIPFAPKYEVTSYWDSDTVNSYLTHSTAKWAQVVGWEYQGMDDSGQFGPKRQSWNGNAHGEVKVFRTAHWKYCTVGLKIGPLCVNSYPRIEIDGHGDGNYSASSRT